MRLSSNERRELATFFAKRLTTDLTPRSNEPVDVLGWERLLGDSDTGRLARRAARVLPDDANLQALCSTLTSGGRRHAVMRVGAVAIAAAAVGLVGLYATTAQDATAADPMQPRVLITAKTAPEPPPPPPVEARVPEAAPIVESPPEVAAVEVPTIEVPAAPAGFVASNDGNCTERPDGFVGYWYAGEARPGRTGDVVEMPHEINVRADYPDEHNRFNARAEVQCILKPGELVRLSVDPIRVPGNAYWVPLRRADLTG